MRRILLTTAFAALFPAAAVAMPLAPALPEATPVIQVQSLPGYYRYDPCMPGAPPVRARIFDPSTESMVDTYIPASRYCRGGGYERPAPRCATMTMSRSTVRAARRRPAGSAIPILAGTRASCADLSLRLC
ncbi:MAG: hypothetical protein FD152_4460 [Xanthobacteraceae bacterium]|nr:MAG: hypothetical protein FD152_4460 [Xanthobacteraceae bacterium]